jgi:hypothetical protein
MGNDFISARFAQQDVLEAQARTKAALQKYEDESIRVRESSDKFYSNLALFSGGTIALSITYLGYLKSTQGREILYPRVLIGAWICLLICAVTSIFCPLFNSYYVHFARLRIYINSLVEQKETAAGAMDNLFLVNVNTPEEKESEKNRLMAETKDKKTSRKWAKRRETISSVLWTGFGWIARLTFPVGIGLLMFFAAKNI